MVASIKQGQASLNRLKWSTTNWSALPDRLTRRWPPFHSPAGGSLSIPEQLEYRRRVDAFKEHLEVLRVNQDQAITRMDKLVQPQDKMNDAVKQELKELLTKTI